MRQGTGIVFPRADLTAKVFRCVRAHLIEGTVMFREGCDEMLGMSHAFKHLVCLARG